MLTPSDTSDQCLRSVLWLLAADGGNMLSIIPDTPRGQARRENGRNISLVLLQLYFMIYNETTDYIMRAHTADDLSRQPGMRRKFGVYSHSDDCYCGGASEGQM